MLVQEWNVMKQQLSERETVDLRAPLVELAALEEKYPDFECLGLEHDIIIACAKAWGLKINDIEDEQPIPDNAEVREVLTWAHNVTMCCNELPTDDSAMFPVKTFYLRVLCEVVEKLRNAKSTRTLSFLRKLGSIEGSAP